MNQERNDTIKICDRQDQCDENEVRQQSDTEENR